MATVKERNHINLFYIIKLWEIFALPQGHIGKSYISGTYGNLLPHRWPFLHLELHGDQSSSGSWLNKKYLA